LKYVNPGATLSIVKDDTPWLNEQENRIWRAFLEATGRISSQLSDSLKEETGLTMDDYEVLVHLSESESQRVRMTELSHRLLHSQSRLTQRVDRLAKRGLVRREKCPEDRRGTFAVLTADGMQLITEAAPQHVRDVRAALIDLIEPEERAMIADVLERLATAARG
jgi:DNA-binding MarR family transcriptional regulator